MIDIELTEKMSFNQKEFDNTKEVILQLMWSKKSFKGKEVNDENLLHDFDKWKK
jgi:hypothetical protein